MNHSFSEYLPAINEEITGRRNGSLVSTDNGRVTTYSIMNLEDRGTIFVELVQRLRRNDCWRE